MWFIAATALLLGVILFAVARSRLKKPAVAIRTERSEPAVADRPAQNWIAADPTVIEEFEAEQETLLFVWDDSEAGSGAPSVTLQPDPLDEGHLQILMEGEIIADVSGNADTLSAADISLIPLSSARVLGFAMP